MNFYLTGLYVLPVLVGGILLIAPAALARIVVILSSILLSVLALFVYFNVHEAVYFNVPHYVNQLVAGADILMLLYFGWVAIRRKSMLVGILSIIQLAGLFYLLKNLPEETSMPFMVDQLSAFMFLLINIISGIIAVFTLRYIEEENCSAFRKKFFLALLFFFIGAMNLVVSADNLEYFFLFFELTTLASFLFIGFRKDEVSVKNAITALWMNQLGGIAILAAIFFIAVGLQIDPLLVLEYWFPVLVFSPFIVDATTTLLRRAWRGERVWEAHRSHFYQRLVQMGVGHRRTALGAYCLMAGCGLSAVGIVQASFSMQCFVITMWVFLYLFMGFRIDRAWRRYVETGS